MSNERHSHFGSAAVLFVAAHAAFLAALVSNFIHDTDARYVVDFAWVAAAAWAATEWIIAQRRERRLQAAGLWFAASALSYLLAVAAWAAVDFAEVGSHFPSIADIFYLLTPMLLVGGMLCLRPDDVVHRYRPLQIANLGLVAAATTVLAVFAIAPRLAGSEDLSVYLVTTIAYWAVYLTAGAFTVLALVGFKWRQKRLVMLLAGVAAVSVVAAIPYSNDLIGHHYRAGAWYDVLWFTAPCLMAMAARDFRNVVDNDHLNESFIAPRTARVVPSALMAGTVFVLGISTAKTLGGVPGGFLLVAAAVVALALALRERAIKQIENLLERKLETALLDSRDKEERFRAFAEATSDFFIETDQNLTILRVIRGTNCSLVADAGWLIGRTFGQVGFPSVENYEPPLEQLRALLERREIIRNFEYEVTTPEGSRVWRRYGGAPYFDQNGQFLGYRFALQNVSQQRLLEIENSRKSAELSRVVRALDATQETIFIIDSQDRIIYLNSAADKSRRTAGQFTAIGKHYAEVFPAFGFENGRLMNSIKAAMAEQGRWTGEIPVRYGDREAIFDTRAAALPDGGLIFAGLDIGDRRRQEQRESVLTARLVEAEKAEAIGKLAGGIAHDFNNIMAAIRSFASLIVHDLPDGHTDRKYAERIVSSSDRAAELVKQILLFARAGNAEHKPISLRNVFEELQHTLRSTTPTHISLQVAPPGPDAVIDGNAAQLLRVFTNLGLNAADAVSPTGGSINVTCERVVLSIAQAADLSPGISVLPATRGQGDRHRYLTRSLLSGRHYCCITVSDNGSGIPADILPRIFEPFFTTKEKTKGTGLGLAVVNSIVKAHDGAVVVVTEPGQGTTFKIYFPAIEAAPWKVPPRENLDAVRGEERVLIVDDEVDVADSLSLALQRFGYETAPVYAPEEALSIFAEDPLAWDVVITDQIMPNMKGLDLARKLKRLNADVDIIVCTGFSDTATEEKAIEAGAAAFLFKPVAPEHIAKIIRRTRA